MPDLGDKRIRYLNDLSPMRVVVTETYTFDEDDHEHYWDRRVTVTKYDQPIIDNLDAYRLDELIGALVRAKEAIS